MVVPMELPMTVAAITNASQPKIAVLRCRVLQRATAPARLRFGRARRLWYWECRDPGPPRGASGSAYSGMRVRMDPPSVEYGHTVSAQGTPPEPVFTYALDSRNLGDASPSGDRPDSA